MEQLDQVVKIVREERLFNPPLQEKLVEFLQPNLLQSELGQGLELGVEGCPEEVRETLKKVARYSVKTCHPGFVNQLYGGVDEVGLAAELLSAALNTNQYTYEVAPVFTLCEKEVIKRVLNKIGFENGDGLFSPGGSIANMYGLVLARYKKCPNIKTKGVSGRKPFVIFTSQDAHYSFKKSGHWLGLGTDHVIAVETDPQGCMVPAGLDRAILEAREAGLDPLAVVSTAGTTVLGAFDPFQQIADVCQSHQIWHHVDACWGGSLMFSKKYSTALRGIERADSISWNPHKMLGAPLQCSLILVKEKGLLKEANRAGATYLFQEDKMYDVDYDTGDLSVQCGRKTDALKLWAIWKYRGDTGLETLVDTAVHLSRYFLEKIRGRAGFKLVLDEFQCSNICFWYIPRRLRGATEDHSWWEEVHKVGPKLKERLVRSGHLMMGYQPLAHRGLKNFFRLVLTCHPPRDLLFMDRIIQLIDQHGADL